MDNAWQSQDATSGISIPVQENGGGGGSPRGDDSGFSNPNGGGNGGGGPRRSSRSRSPGDRDRDDRSRDAGEANPGNNLHVSGLSNKVDSRDLEAAFGKIGRVIKAQVVYDPHTRESRLFGFVTMQSGDEAEAAIAALNATEFMGKVITVAKARRGRARTPTPGRYHGPSKRSANTYDRPYDPRPYDSRYARDYDDRRGGRGGRYDRDRGRYDDRDRDRERDRYRDYDRDRERDRDREPRRDDRERRYDDRDRDRRY